MKDQINTKTTFPKTYCKLIKTFVKLRLPFQSLTTRKTGELLLTANSPNLSNLAIWRVTANSPKFGFQYNLNS